jgi:hypothetical protein
MGLLRERVRHASIPTCGWSRRSRESAHYLRSRVCRYRLDLAGNESFPRIQPIPTEKLHLQDKTNTLIDLYKEVNRVVEELQTCPFTTEAFSELIGKVQASVRPRSIFRFRACTDVGFSS